MKNKPVVIVFAILWLLMGIAVIYYTWDWIVQISAQQGDDVFLAIYWVGYALIALCTGIIPPFWLITQAMQRDE